MSFNYTALSESATDLIKRFGRSLTFTRTTKGAYDPATGTTSDTSTTFSKYACVFDYSNADSAGLTIEAGDRRLLAEYYAYEVGDAVALDGEVYRVVSVSENRPASTGLSVNLQVRQ